MPQSKTIKTERLYQGRIIDLIIEEVFAGYHYERC
jgi:hypothetical protein